MDLGSGLTFLYFQKLMGLACVQCMHCGELRVFGSGLTFTGFSEADAVSMRMNYCELRIWVLGEPINDFGA